MRVHDLFEAKNPAAGVEALKAWIVANVKLTPALEKKNPMLWTRTPYRVWTRGDGYRYKDAPYVEFTDRAYADLAWSELLKLPHEQVTLLGPFGSDRHEAYVIGQNIYTRGPEAIFVYRKAGVMASKVMSIDAGTDNLIFSIIEKKLQGGKKLRINIKTLDLLGTITGIDGRELTVLQDNGNTQPQLMPFDTDVRYTIKDIDGIATLVKK